MSDFLQFEEGEGVNRLEQREYRQGLMADPSASYDLGSRRGSFADDDDAEANARAQRPDTQYPNEQYRYAHEDPAFWNAPRFKPQHGTKTDTNFHTNPVYDRFGIDEVDSRYVDHENEEFKPRFWQDTGGGDSARLGYDTSELLQASDESELSDPTPSSHARGTIHSTRTVASRITCANCSSRRPRKALRRRPLRIRVGLP